MHPGTAFSLDLAVGLSQPPPRRNMPRFARPAPNVCPGFGAAQSILTPDPSRYAGRGETKVRLRRRTDERFAAAKRFLQRRDDEKARGAAHFQAAASSVILSDVEGPLARRQPSIKQPGVEGGAR